MIDWMDLEFVQICDRFQESCEVALFMCNISCLGEFARSNGFPSMILRMTWLQKWTAVHLVLGGNVVITGKPSEDQNIGTMTFGVDILVLERHYHFTPSGNRIHS
jgi:hypothetical protein